MTAIRNSESAKSIQDFLQH